MVNMLWELNIVKVDNTLISTIELLFYETDLARIASENSLISKFWAVKYFDTVPLEILAFLNWCREVKQNI